MAATATEEETDGGHEAALAPDRANAPDAGSSFGGCPGLPRPRKPRPFPAHSLPLATVQGGRGRQVRVLLFCSCWGGWAQLLGKSTPRAACAPWPSRRCRPFSATEPPKPDTRGG